MYIFPYTLQNDNYCMSLQPGDDAGVADDNYEIKDIMVKYNYIVYSEWFLNSF